jgi:hypothetical protein
MKFKQLVLAAAMGCSAAGSFAVPVTVLGSTFDITFDNALLGLFGTPTLVGNVIEWFPSGSPGFTAEASTGTAVTHSTFAVQVTAHPGFELASFALAEGGDYVYFGSSAGAGVAVSGQLRVTPLPGTPISHAIANPVLTANPILFDFTTHDWTASAAPITLSAGTTAANATVENILAAFVPSPITGYAYIEKKDVFLTVGVNPVPERATSALMLAGLGVIGFVALRRRDRR